MLMEGYFVDSNGIKYYPRPSFHIGYILESAIEIDPGTIYGGTWEEYGKGRTTVGVDKTNPKMNEAGKEFGSPYLQKHVHHIKFFGKTILMNEGSNYGTYIGAGDKYTDEAGEGNEGNYQPSIAVYRYVRIA